jgi:hypothetical protein
MHVQYGTNNRGIDIVLTMCITGSLNLRGEESTSPLQSRLGCAGRSAVPSYPQNLIPNALDRWSDPTKIQQYIFHIGDDTFYIYAEM